MYKKEFTKFNGIMNKIMDEQTTLEVHLSAEFSQNVPKGFLTYTPNEWAEYAFKNEAEYSVNYYKKDKPYCEVVIDSMTISLSFYNEDNLSKKDLMIVFFKGEIIELAKTILFYSNKKKNNVLLREWILEDGKKMLIEQYGTADLSKHWFDAPQNYLDYERFLDYQKMFDNLPSLES